MKIRRKPGLTFRGCILFLPTSNIMYTKTTITVL